MPESEATQVPETPKAALVRRTRARPVTMTRKKIVAIVNMQYAEAERLLAMSLDRVAHPEDRDREMLACQGWDLIARATALMTSTGYSPFAKSGRKPQKDRRGGTTIPDAPRPVDMPKTIADLQGFREKLLEEAKRRRFAVPGNGSPPAEGA